MANLRGKRRATLLISTLPLAIAAVGLTLELSRSVLVFARVCWPLPGLELAVPGVLWSAARLCGHPPRQALRLALLAPCVLAPLALLYPWTIAPSGLPGVGFGGLGFFVHWLTKYPNAGPINLQVLLGLLCVLGASVMPAIFGIYIIASVAPRRSIAVALLALTAVPFVPVLVVLDLPLYRAALIPGYGCLATGALARALPWPSMLVLSYRPQAASRSR